MLLIKFTLLLFALLYLCFLIYIRSEFKVLCNSIDLLNDSLNELTFRIRLTKF